jgi:RNA polymerase sigma-70 factor, ECF subfamily
MGEVRKTLVLFQLQSVCGEVTAFRRVDFSTWERGPSVNFEAFDGSYVSRLRAGDASTEQHFVGYFSELITLKLRSRLRAPEVIEDLKQETFSRALTLIRSEGGVRNPERLGPLVNSICNNVLMEQYRASGRVEALDEAAAEQIAETRPDALSMVISHDTRDVVRKVLAKLKRRDRDVLRAVFLEERDKDKVCREMGVDREYLRVLLHRAKGAFRELYSRRVGEKP